MLTEAEGRKMVVLISTGSEVALAIKARQELQAKGIGTRVVSMPCMELFAVQEQDYRQSVLLGGNIVRIGIEAGIRQGWDRWLLGERAAAGKSDFVGMDSFGASAPAEELFEHFGITAKKIVSRAEALL